MSLLKVKKDGTWISVVSDYAARALVAAHNLAGDAHAGLFNSKVNTVENSLTTTNKNVVGAINELDSSDDTINARIDNIGRYLALWNGPAGLPTTSPATLPYTYKAGDHYKISTITGYAHTVVISPWAGSNYTATVYSSDSTPFTDTTTYAEWLRNRGYSAQNPLTATGTIYGCPAKDYYTYYASADRSWKFYLEYIENGRTYGVYRDPSDLTITDTVSAATICYRPNGSTYTGIASTTVETSPDVAVGDIYFYDGTAWSLQINHGANAYNKTEADTLFATKTELSAKSAVSVSSTGTATDEVQYITVDGVEKKLKGAGAWGEIGGTLSNQTDLQSELTRLDGRCDNLQNLGRYLALWNSLTGLPTTNPSSLPYTYKAGDYYRVNTVKVATYTHTVHIAYGTSGIYSDVIINNESSTPFTDETIQDWLTNNGYVGTSHYYTNCSGPYIGASLNGTIKGIAMDDILDSYLTYSVLDLNGVYHDINQRWYFENVTDTVTTNINHAPSGSTYTGTASTTVETGDVQVGDVYFYDGTSWSLQINHNLDSYTKTESDALFATKATTYTKTEVDTALATKAPQATTYTKTEVDTALATKIEATSATLSTAMPVDANTLEGHAASYFATASALGNKVDKVAGKGLSTNDYDATEKANVASNTTARHSHSNKQTLDNIDSTKVTAWDGKSTVSVSASGSATDEVQYITIDGTEKKLAGGGGDDVSFGNNSDIVVTDGTNITVIANPTMAGGETALSGLQVGSTKYAISGSGSNNLYLHTLMVAFTIRRSIDGNGYGTLNFLSTVSTPVTNIASLISALTCYQDGVHLSVSGGGRIVRYGDTVLSPHYFLDFYKWENEIYWDFRSDDDYQQFTAVGSNSNEFKNFYITSADKVTQLI